MREKEKYHLIRLKSHLIHPPLFLLHHHCGSFALSCVGWRDPHQLVQEEEKVKNEKEEQGHNDHSGVKVIFSLLSSCSSLSNSQVISDTLSAFFQERDRVLKLHVAKLFFICQTFNAVC